MKILFITPNYKEPNAWMASSYNISQALAQRGHEILVLTSKTKGSTEEEQFGTVKVKRFKSWLLPDPFNVAIVPFFTNKVLSAIKWYKPDKIIISKVMFWTSLSMFIIKPFCRATEIIVFVDTFPGLNWFAPSKTLNFCAKIYSKTIGKWILKLADKVVLLSKDLVETADKLGLENYTVIRTCVDVKKYVG